jgi:hypothetical protein
MMAGTAQYLSVRTSAIAESLERKSDGLDDVATSECDETMIRGGVVVVCLGDGRLQIAKRRGGGGEGFGRVSRSYSPRLPHNPCHLDGGRNEGRTNVRELDTRGIRRQE